MAARLAATSSAACPGTAPRSPAPFARARVASAAWRCGTRGSSIRPGGLDQRRAGGRGVGAVAAREQHALVGAATMRGARSSVPASSTMMASFRKGSIICGRSVGKSRPASDSKRVRGDTRRFGPSPLKAAGPCAGAPAAGLFQVQDLAGVDAVRVAHLLMFMPHSSGQRHGLRRNRPEMAQSVSPGLTVYCPARWAPVRERNALLGTCCAVERCCGRDGIVLGLGRGWRRSSHDHAAAAASDRTAALPAGGKAAWLDGAISFTSALDKLLANSALKPLIGQCLLPWRRRQRQKWRK
jgi:hypothetical protein